MAERLPIRGTGEELDSLALTINGLLERIAAYLQQEHDFLANAAHDLRTPLAAIQSSVEVALSGPRNEEEYRDLLGLVIEQCAALQTLVNQLLLLAETPSAAFWVAAALMALGVWLHISERHRHAHRHESMAHDHEHLHDAHHHHEHAFPWDGKEPHTHAHQHDALAHSHPHHPDLHHRHRH